MNSFARPAMVLACIVALHTGCSRNDLSANELIEQLPGKSWIISRFSSEGKDDTDAFKGFVFAFKQNGQLFVSKGGNKIEASWVIQESASRFIINMGPNDFTNKPLGALTKYWTLVDYNAGKLSLSADGGPGNGILEFITQ